MTTDFDQTLSGLQSTHSKHILFSDDRNLTDRFFIHLTWRFSIIIFSKFTELIFRKINFENFIGKSIHLYIHNHFTTYFSAMASFSTVIRRIDPTDHECKAAHKILTQIFARRAFCVDELQFWWCSVSIYLCICHAQIGKSKRLLEFYG